MHKNIICIPAYKEKKTLSRILKKISKDYKVLVCDDNSGDGTSSIKLKNVIIKTNKTNMGYEKNILNAFQSSYIKKYRYIITFDADGEHDYKDLPKFFSLIKNNKPDLIIGNRKFKRRVSEKVISFFFDKLFGVKDPLSGFKAYKISKLRKNLRHFKSNYFLVDIIIYFLKNNFKIEYIDINSISIKKRVSRIGDNFKILKKMLGVLSLIIYR